MSRGRRNQVLVLLATGFEEVDVTAIASALRHAGLPVALVGLTAGPVRGAYGLSLVPDLTLGEVEAEPAAAVLPGGLQAARLLNAEPRVHLLLHRVVAAGGYIVAIDQAYMVARQAGLLAGPAADEAMPHWQMAALLGEAVIVGGPLILGRDSGAARETALTLIALIEGRERAGPRR